MIYTKLSATAYFLLHESEQENDVISQLFVKELLQTTIAQLVSFKPSSAPYQGIAGLPAANLTYTRPDFEIRAEYTCNGRYRRLSEILVPTNTTHRETKESSVQLFSTCKLQSSHLGSSKQQRKLRLGGALQSVCLCCEEFRENKEEIY